MLNSTSVLSIGVKNRTFDKKLKETKELFEKWKSFTDSKGKNIPTDELRQYTRSMNKMNGLRS